MRGGGEGEDDREVDDDGALRQLSQEQVRLLSELLPNFAFIIHFLYFL